MKKILAFLLSMMLLLGCTSAEASITGEWYGLMQGIPAVFTLQEDGTYTVTAGSEGISGTWMLDGNDLILDIETNFPTVFTYDAEAAVLSMIVENDELMRFTREPIEMFAPAAVRTDAALEEFAGLWDSDMVGGRGTFVEPEVTGIGLVAEITGTHVALTPVSLTGSDAQDPTYEGEGVFADGVLTVTLPSIVGTNKETIYSITLLEDGMMAISFTVYDNPFAYYMNAF